MTQASRFSSAKPVSFLGGDAELVAGLKAANPAAQQAFFGRYARFVERLLLGVLGPDAELGDVMQDTFISAFRQIRNLRTADALTEWLRTIAVGVAQNRIRSRTRNRWLLFFAPEQIPDVPSLPARAEATQALRAVYAVLEQMPAHERVVFALRYIEDMTVPEIAHTTKVSESTVKRRLQQAERLFEDGKHKHPALADWVAAMGAS